MAVHALNVVGSEQSPKAGQGRPRLRLGERLIQLGLIDEECLKLALRKQRKDGGLLGEALVALGFIDEEVLVKVLATDVDAEFVNILDVDVDPEALAKVPVAFARRWRLMPYAIESGQLRVAVDDPLNVTPLDMLWKQTGMRILPAVAPLRDIETAIERYYGDVETLDEIIDQIIAGTVDEAQLEAPVVRLLDKVITHAVRHQATDIHIEPAERTLGIRMRVDGLLSDVCLLPANVLAPLVSRVKILSDLDLSERRLPQDGSFTFEMGRRRVELRVSTMPTIHGEKVVLRILDRGSVEMTLEGIELPQWMRDDPMRRLHLNDPYGMILVTGPTGSGKTTTLYSMLHALQSAEKAIYTVEDPVEYRIKGLQQVTVREEIGFTFSNILRSMLRQDPDVIMVGEIRDPDTAALAVQASLTGHIVLSTLHTNNAIETIFRLIEMGVDPYLIPPSLHGVIAQRLVRRLCRHCREPLPESFSRSVVEAHGLDPDREWRFWKSVGCEHCIHGYSGRLAIFEWLDLDERFHDVVTRDMTLAQLERTAREAGYRPMLYDGMEKAANGETTVAEVLRVTRHA
ncbi:MAG: GspE/PulE family protein [Mariprofundaceae bacterium]